MGFQRYLVAALIGLPSLAFGQADTVVLRVTSPRGTEVQFSGVITLRDGKTERRLENVSTPYEIRLAAQNVDARFTAVDGGGLSGDLTTYREGKQRGHVTGTRYSGTVRLYHEPGVAFGFGGRGPHALFP